MLPHRCAILQFMQSLVRVFFLKSRQFTKNIDTLFLIW